jgi:hypothetical protein
MGYSKCEIYTIAPPQPLFPNTVRVGEVSITLHADGSWEGDREAFLTAVRDDAKRDVSDVTMPILWLIANAIKKD